MDFEEAKQRVTALREQIEYHSRRYYDLDDPEIEDSEFDALTRELRTLETDYPQLVTADSYTQRVHGEVSALFTPVAHEVPLASLQDVFDIEELREFDLRVRETVEDPQYVVEPKIDGLSVALEYVDGVFKRGATRGDGVTGRDVSANLRTIRSIPARLTAPLPASSSGERCICPGRVSPPWWSGRSSKGKNRLKTRGTRRRDPCAKRIPGSRGAGGWISLSSTSSSSRGRR